MNHSVNRLFSAKEVVQWCIVALSHETNRTREVQRYIQFNFIGFIILNSVHLSQ